MLCLWNSCKQRKQPLLINYTVYGVTDVYFLMNPFLINFSRARGPSYGWGQSSFLRPLIGLYKAQGISFRKKKYITNTSVIMGASGGGIPRASGLFGAYYEYKESENSIRTSIRWHIPPLGNSRGGAFFITSSGHLSPFAFQRNITLHISKEAPPSHADACNVRRVCVFTSNLNLNAQNSDCTICHMSKK